MRIFVTGALAPFVAVALSVASAGCGGDDPPAKTDTSTMTDTVMQDTTMPDTTVAQTPCQRAGGAAAVASVVYNKANAADPATLVGTFAGNCKINQHFLTIGAERLNHTGECLAIQVQELFGCEGVSYATAKDSLGAACRDMKTAHTGLAISKGDFDALIADVVSFVSPLADPSVGVLTEAELNATAAVLLSLEGDIVEAPENTGLSKDDCETASTPCERAGGAAAVASVVYNKANAADPATLVGTFAGNCKINQHFLTIGAERLNHTGECLAIQVQQLFGCEGVDYATSKDSLGVACRDMKTAHTGLEISKGDFDALIADVVSFVSPLAAPEVGVLTDDELTATAAVLLSLEGDIVEAPENTGLSKDNCEEVSTPCTRAGGAAAVAGVVYNKDNAADPATLVGTFAGNCKINQHFLTIGAERLNHTGECLAIQVQQLFGCEGVDYATSKDSLGVACRDMKTAHTGLAISKGDFDALIADVVSFVSPLAAPEVGVLTEAELNATAAVLLSLEGDIVEAPENTGLTKDDCAE